MGIVRYKDKHEQPGKGMIKFKENNTQTPPGKGPMGRQLRLCREITSSPTRFHWGAQSKRTKNPPNHISSQERTCSLRGTAMSMDLSIK